MRFKTALKKVIIGTISLIVIVSMILLIIALMDISSVKNSGDNFSDPIQVVLAYEEIVDGFDFGNYFEFMAPDVALEIKNGQSGFFNEVYGDADIGFGRRMVEKLLKFAVGFEFDLEVEDCTYLDESNAIVHTSIESNMRFSDHAATGSWDAPLQKIEGRWYLMEEVPYSIVNP